MKKWVTAVSVMLFVLTGCVGMEVKRGVQGNHFYSTQPQLALDLDPNLEYMDKTTDNSWGTYYNSESGTSSDNERHVFFDRRTGTTVLVSITKIHKGYWMAPDLTKQPNVISSGNEIHMGERYPYVVRVIKNEKGICELIKEYVRITGGGRDTNLTIVYFEPLDENGANCENWHDDATANASKRKRVQAFLDNCEKKMKFVDVKTLTLGEK